jgi:hypothetical protein
MGVNPKIDPDPTVASRIFYRILLVLVVIVFICGSILRWPFRKIKKIYLKIKYNRRLKRDSIAHLVDKK